MTTRRFVQAGALTLALYGFAAWVYVAVSAIVVPRTFTCHSPTSQIGLAKTRSALPLSRYLLWPS
jgi:hypothetical protein